MAGHPGNKYRLKYDPKYCDELIKFMTEDGLSFEAFCGKIGIARSTGYEWVEEYPDFAEAKRVANAAAQYYWENESKKGLWGSKDAFFNSTVWIFTMKNQFGWREKQEIVGPDGGPIQISDMTQETLDQKLIELWTRLNPSTTKKSDEPS
jgi:hypothetical protein